MPRPLKRSPSTKIQSSSRAGLIFTFRIPSIIKVPNGDLLAFAEGRESLRDEGDIDLVMKRSSDLGQTWGELQVIIDNGPDTTINPYSTTQLEDSGSPTAPTR